tara:strand:+ start:104 stop:478 length:375 start_codon:yes stop_codon:yes gene_type:complete
MNFIKKKKKYKKILCFDIDGVICKTNKNDYKSAEPILESVKMINKLYNHNFYIKLFTARFMGRNSDNCQKAKNEGLILTKKQLKTWGVKYHKLLMCKPSYDLFVDDKALNFKKNWQVLLQKKLF